MAEAIQMADGRYVYPAAEVDFEFAQLRGQRDELLEALLLNWKHTDDSGRVFYCDCPMFGRLTDDSSKDSDDKHSTCCREGRAAIAKATSAARNES